MTLYLGIFISKITKIHFIPDLRKKIEAFESFGELQLRIKGNRMHIKQNKIICSSTMVKAFAVNSKPQKFNDPLLKHTCF